MKKLDHLKIRLLRKLSEINFDTERMYLTLTLVAGLGAGLLAVLMRTSISFLSHSLGTHEQFTLTTLFAGLFLIAVSGYLTTRFFPSTSGSGVPFVKVAITVYNGNIRLFQWFFKMITSIFSLSSGIALGMEGPTVMVSSGFASSLGQMFNLSKRRVKALCAVGSAGGIAAAFNTPIAAVVFTLEEIVGDMNARMLGAIVISSVIASVTAAMLLGNNAIFPYTSYTYQSPIELLVYFSLGIFAAFLGPLFVKGMLKLRGFYKSRYKGNVLVSSMLAITIMALLSQITPHVLGSGHHTISLLLDGDLSSAWNISGLFLLKFVAIIICFSSGISGGLFMPTLCLGALSGALMEQLWSPVLPQSLDNISAFVLVGMGAFFAAVIRAPFTSILMIFEMTENHEIILPLMIANITAYTIANKLQDGSVYENLSEQEGVHLPSKDDHEVLKTLLVEDAMTRDVVILSANQTIGDAYKMSLKTGFAGFPIEKDEKIYGMISIEDVNTYKAQNKKEAFLRDLCTTQVISVYPDQSLLLAFHLLKKYHISRLPVVSRLNDSIVGILTAEDIVSHFGFHIQEEQVEESLALSKS